MLTLALAPIASFFSIGCAACWNELSLRVTGLVTPLIVSLPSTATGFSPSKTTLVDLKVAVGYLAVSRKSSPWMCSLNSGKPVLTEVVSITMSTEPVFAALSKTIVPLVLSKRESCCE